MPKREEVEKLAYTLWEKDGKPQGQDQRYYYEAERRLKEQETLKRATEMAPRPAPPPPLTMDQAKKPAPASDGMGRTDASTRTRRRPGSK